MKLYIKFKPISKDGKEVNPWTCADELVLFHTLQEYTVRILTTEIEFTIDEEGYRILACKNIEAEFEDVPAKKRLSLKTVLRELKLFAVDSIAFYGGNDERYSDDFDIEIIGMALVDYTGKRWVEKNFTPLQLSEVNKYIEI